VIEAVPGPTEVTLPVDTSTEATEAADEAQANVGTGVTAAPPASLATAWNVSVSPADVKPRDPGVMETEETAWATVMVTAADTPPDVAVIVALPLATAVTSPVPDPTVATAGADDTHVTAASIASPRASLGVALSLNVSPK
jgi:hypothetical protein